MRDARKTKAQLVRELGTMRTRLKRLETWIDKHKRSEASLRESEERYRLLIEKSGEAILDTQPDGQILSANPAACRMLGRSEAEIRKIGRAGVVDKSDPRLKAGLERRANAGKAKAELNLIRSDGTIFPAEVSSVVFKDSHGNKRTSMFINDISERKRAEEALRYSENKFSKAFRASPDVLVISRRSDGLIVDTNDSWERLFGYKREEVIGRSSLDLALFVNPADRNEIVTRLQEQGVVRDVEVETRGKSGETRQVILTVEPIEMDVEPCMLTIIHDITERKRREKELVYEARLHKFRSETAYAINRQGSLEEILQESAEAITRNLDIACAHIWIMNRETNSLTLKARSEVDTLHLEHDECTFIGNVVAGSVLAEGQTIIGNSIPDGPVTIDIAWAREYGIVAYAGLPLFVEEQIVGVVTVFADTPLHEATLSPLAGSAVTLAQGIVRKEAEAANVLLAHAMRSVSECVSITDNDNKILFVNDAFLRTYGYAADELIGKPISVVRSPRSEPAVDKILSRTLEGGWQGEMVNQKKDGTEFPVALSTSVVRNEKGQSIALVGIVADITERKRAEEALQESEEKFRSLWENNSVGMRITNEEGTVLLANDEYCKLMEKAHDEVEGNPMCTVYEEARHADILRKHQERFRARSIPAFLERDVTLWNGKKISLQLSNSFLTNANQPTLALSVFRDDSERKRAEEARRETERKFRDVVETAHEIIFTTDLRGNFTYVNPAGLAKIGYTLDEMQQFSYLDLALPEHQARLKRLYYRQYLEKTPTTYVEYLTRTKSGDVLWVGQNGTLVVEGETILGFHLIARDITERKRAEASLKQALEWQEAIFEGSRDAVFISDEDSRFVAVNGAASQLTGYTREQLLTMRIPDLHDHLDLAAFNTYNKRIFAGEEILSDAKILRSDGAKVDTEFNNKCVSIAGKLYMHTSARDITERKRAERLLQESERRFREMLENVDLIALSIDTDGHVVFCNEYLLKLTDWKWEEVIHTDWFSKFIPAEAMEIKQLLFDSLANSDIPPHHENPIKTKSGEIREIRWNNTLLRDGEGKIVGIASIGEDITLRKRAEEAQRESSAIFNTTFHASPFPISITDLSTDKWLEVNEAFLDVMGFSRSEFIGHSFQEINLWKHPEERDEMRKLLLEKGRVSNFEVNIDKKNGVGGIMLLSAEQIHLAGKPCLLIMGNEITERKRAEEALRESESQYRELWEATVEGITILDKGIIVSVNEAMCGMFGCTREQSIGKSLLDFAPPEVHDSLRARAMSGVAGRFETPALRADGTRIMLEAIAKPILYHGKLMRMVAVRDITERKQMEQSLKTERTLLSAIIETIPDEICLKDTDSRFIMANKASIAALGAKSLEDMIGKTDLDYIRRELALPLLAEEKQLLETGEPSIGREVVRLDPKTGRISKCDLYTKVPVKAQDGTTIGLLVINMDITQRKRAEENVRRSELRLRQLSAHLESVREEERKHIAQEFHDQLGQTLTALKMDLSLLERGLVDEKKEISRATLLGEIRSSQELIDRGIQTVRAIMSELRPELLDQLGLVEALEWEIGKFQQRSGVLCGLTVDVGELAFDAQRSIALFRLVQEALTNVARHAQAKSVDVIIRREGDDIILEIKDDGIGISLEAENKPRSFGLIGMRERALFLGGNLEITGITGKGTTIAVRMPMHEMLPDGGGE